MSVNCFSSCKECTDRTVGCHATCERYLKEKEEHAKCVKVIRADNDYSLYRCRAIGKAKDISSKKKTRNHGYAFL